MTLNRKRNGDSGGRGWASVKWGLILLWTWPKKRWVCCAASWDTAAPPIATGRDHVRQGIGPDSEPPTSGRPRERGHPRPICRV